MVKRRLGLALLLASVALFSGCMVTFQDLYGVRDSLQTQISSLETDLDQVKNKEASEQAAETQKAKALRVEVDVLRTAVADLTTHIEELKSDVNMVRARQADLGGEVEEIRTQERLQAGDIEKEVQLLQRKLGSEDLAGNASRIDRLESEAAGLRKRLENLEAALAGLETGKQPVREASKPSKVQPEPAPPTPPVPAPPEPPQAPGESVSMDPDKLYKAATAAFKKGDYAQARTLYSEFCGKYSNHPIADNAQFWVGETYYKEGKFEDAILEYQKVIQRYSTGNKVPDALLKQALSFKKLGDKTSAKILFQKLIKEHSESSQAQMAFRELRRLD